MPYFFVPFPSLALDELPQIWDIFVGNLSIIGPRPCLGKQEYLIGLREKYGANDIKPGLTGWAQINGRDELELEKKAKLDGEYVKKKSLLFDMKCFLGTIKKVIKSEGVVEGFDQNKKKVVWIINQYNTLPEHGRLNRHYYFSRHLYNDGYEPVLFLGSSPHGTDLQLIEDNQPYLINDSHGFKTVFINARNYKGSTKKRALSMLDFYINLLKSADKFQRPDVIIGSNAHPLNCVLAIQLAHKYNVKGISEVRDLWPESLTEFGIIKKGSPVEKGIYALFKWIYKKSDKIIFTFRGGKSYIEDIGLERDIEIEKIEYLNNGIDLELFYENKERYQVEDEDLNSEAFKVVYAGAMGPPNQIGDIVEAAEELYSRGYTDIKFILYGDGSEREKYENYCKDNGIRNVFFKGFIEKNKIPSVLSQANVNIITIKESSLYKYGISTNKVFDYLAAGKPIVANNECIESITGNSICVIKCRNLSDGVLNSYNLNDADCLMMSKEAQNLAERYSYDSLTSKLEDILEG